MKVKILTDQELPKYETEYSAGVDLCARLYNGYVTIPSHGGRRLIPTGIRVSIPIGYEIRIQPRSGLALRYGVTVLNSPGCCDSDYRGEIGVILINHSDVNFTVKNGDRIAQAILSKVEKIEWEQVDTLDETARGEGGFGSTGI